MEQDVSTSLDRLVTYIERCGFRGYDPYDGLNSPLLRVLGRTGKYSRIAAIQFMKRCPVNLRNVLRVPKGYNPKGLGLFLWGYAKLRATGYDVRANQIETLLQLLSESRSPNCSGNAWGYNFDWQSRAFYVPKCTPTIVNSSFIGHALLDLYEITGNRQALKLAIPIKDFILGDLNRTRNGDTHCFSYTPIDNTAVHNANLLGASILIRIYEHVGETSIRDAALSSLAYTMNHQRADGSWTYAETSYQQWVDSFHTGFNLQAIDYFLRAGEAEEFRGDFECGVQYYANNFFLDDGTAKYYHNRVEPVDIHSYAQAIVFFSRMGDHYRALTDRVVGSLMTTFQSPKGYYYFQRTPRITNRIPYMRWGQAWAFHALTEYLRAFSDEHKDVIPC